MPLPANVRTSNEVKSGLRNLSFSNPLFQGNKLRNCSAFDTKFENLADISLFTAATKPSNSPLTPAGSLKINLSVIATPFPSSSNPILDRHLVDEPMSGLTY